MLAQAVANGQQRDLWSEVKKFENHKKNLLPVQLIIVQTMQVLQIYLLVNTEIYTLVFPPTK